MNKIKLIIVWILVIGCLVGLFLVDAGYITKKQTIRFNFEEETISANYFPGNKDVGVLAFGGLSSDQQSMINFVNIAVNDGAHAMTFDHIGHGASSGYLTLDNNETNRIAREVKVALEYFMYISGLNYNEIIVVGHSIGARAIVQILTEYDITFKGIFLIAPYFDFKDGGADDGRGWILDVNNDVLNNVRTDIVTGEMDELVTTYQVHRLFEKLTDSTMLNQENYHIVGNVSVRVVPFVTHNYEVLSVQILSLFSSLYEEVTNTTNPIGIWFGLARYVLLISMVILVTISLHLVPKVFRKTGTQNASINMNLKEFCRTKIKIWLYSLPVIVILSIFFIYMRAPLLNLLLASIWFGFGLSGFIQYRKKGLLLLETQVNVKGIIASIGLLLDVLIVMILLYRRGLNYIVPFNTRFIWLFVFILMSSMFYLVIKSDENILDINNMNWIQKWSTKLTNYPVLVIVAVISIFILNVTAMMILIQLVIVLIIAKLVADAVLSISKNSYLATLSYGVIFSTLIITYSLVIRIF